MKNDGCNGSQFSSADCVCNVRTIWFNKAESRDSRVVCSCPCHLFSLMNLVSMYAQSFQSGTILAKCGLDCLGESDS